MKTPESVLKKQATQTKIAEAKAAAEKETAAKAKTDATKFVEKAKKYDAEYAAAERASIDNRRKAKADGGFYVEAEPKLALVIRVRGTIGVSPKAKKVMQVRYQTVLLDGAIDQPLSNPFYSFSASANCTTPPLSS